MSRLGQRLAIVAALCTVTALGAFFMLQPGSAQPPQQQAQAAQAAALPRPVLETHDLMKLFNRPLYEMLRKEMRETSDSDDHWSTIANRGLQTAEVANLVALRNNQRGWQQLSLNLHQAGLQLAQAANAQDQDATLQAYRGLVQRCNECHQAAAPEHAPQLEP